MRVQKQYKVEKLDELWAIDWKEDKHYHRELYFYLEQDLGIEPDSVEAMFLWNLLRTIRKENADASTYRREKEASSSTKETTDSFGPQ